jgi:FSR family fosmidomycin resistance protein-like MFS transporter
MTKNEKNIINFTSAGHFFTHFYILLVPVIAMPVSRTLNLPASDILGMSFLMYMLYGFLAVPWGFLSDQFKPRLVMGCGILIVGLGYIAAGFFPQKNLLPFFFSIVGVGCAAYHPSGLALISKGVRKRGKALGINGSFGNAGIACSPFVGGILTYFTGWQNTLLILGLFGLLVGISILAVPFHVERDEEKQKNTVLDKTDKLKAFLFLCAVVIFSGLMYRGFTLILPMFLEVKLQNVIAGIEQELKFLNDFNVQGNKGSLFAALLATGVYLIGMVGQIVGGRIADRYDLRWGYFAFFAISFPFLLFMSFFSNLVIWLLAGCYVFFTLGMQPIENSLYAMVTPTRWRSFSYGIKFTLVFGVGSFSVLIVKYVEKTFSIDAVIYVLIFYLAVVILLTVLLIVITGKREFRHVHANP